MNGARKRIAGAAIGAALALCGAAAAAPGDTVYRGQTAEGVKVKLTVANPGNATKFRLGESEVDCEEGGTLSNDPFTYRKLDRSDPGSFSDKRTYKNRSGGFQFKTRSQIKGSVVDRGDAWRGVFALRTKVRDDGETIDVCKLTTTWEAS
jgi:hypothetical protein